MLHFLKNKIMTIAIILTPFTVFAEHTPYFKGFFGINKFNQISNFNNFKQSSNFSPELGIGGGAGLIFDDSFRGEVIVSYTKITFRNNCKLSTFYDVHLNNKKVVINSTMLNIYKDFFDRFGRSIVVYIIDSSVAIVIPQPLHVLFPLAIKPPHL
jgi:hypothetical protein